MAKRTLKSTFRDVITADYTTMQRGENGFPEYTDSGVGSNVLLISQLIRGGDPTSPTTEILKTGSSQDVVDLVVLTFATRNTRGGKGEKDIAYAMFLGLWKALPMTAQNLLPLFAHYGYWKDLLRLMVIAKRDPGAIDLVNAALVIMSDQFQKDVIALATHKNQLSIASNESEKAALRSKGPSLSLLPKWLPRECSKFDKELDFVNRFSKLVWSNTHLDFDLSWQSNIKAKYRRIVAELTSYYDLPEVLLSLKRADEIKFHKLASRATFCLTKALLNEDRAGKRRSDDPKRIRLAQMFISNLTQNGAKGGQIMPHEIVRKILKHNISKSEEIVLDAQWKDMVKTVLDQVRAKAESKGLDFNPTDMVPLSDVSGSMFGVPMEVSIALGILISEITHEAFRDMVLTFESRPRWHRLVPMDTIVHKVRSLSRANWGGSTNFLAAYQLILDVAQKHRLSWEELPTLIVFSDMQFDKAYSDCQDVQKTLDEAFASTALSLGWSEVTPKPIVYWNLRDTGGHPVQKDTEGAILLAGFSPSLLKLVMNGEDLAETDIEIVDDDGTVRTEKVRVTPEQILRRMLDDPLYDPVRVILSTSSEGALREYNADVDPNAIDVDGFALM